MVEIIPAILTDDPRKLTKMLSQAEEVVERVQIDIVDGQFAKNKTIDPSVLANVETSLKLDFHLMVKEPINWVEKAVGGMTGRTIGHIEQMSDQVKFVGKVQGIGLAVGLAINITTKADEIDPTILNNLDVVLVMSVPAGFGGQRFDERVLDKIRKLDETRVRDATPFKICVDGGITEATVARVRKAGADEVAVGKRIFTGDIKSNIDRLKKVAYNK